MAVAMAMLSRLFGLYLSKKGAQLNSRYQGCIFICDSMLEKLFHHNRLPSKETDAFLSLKESSHK